MSTREDAMSTVRYGPATTKDGVVDVQRTGVKNKLETKSRDDDQACNLVLRGGLLEVQEPGTKN